MPRGEHSIVIDLPIQEVWEFVSVMDKWAPLVPGYIQHQILSERQSTWEFTGDLGIMKKKIKMQVDVTEWKEPNKVTFNLTGLNDNFSGEGFFEAEMVDEFSTITTGCLDITQKGMLAAIVNPVLKSFVPETATELTEAIANELCCKYEVAE
jgi:carbon monoxide dehydrogenase subunit G